MRTTIQRLFKTETQFALLALAPLLLLPAKFSSFINMGLVAVGLILLLTAILFYLRKLIPAQLRPAVVLIVSISLVLIAQMLMDANAYSFAENSSLFFPLMLINSLVLSLGEKVFSKQTHQSVIRYVSGIALAVLLFFMLYGLLKELAGGYSIIDSVAGCFFLLGFLFAFFNFLQNANMPD